MAFGFPHLKRMNESGWVWCIDAHEVVSAILQGSMKVGAGNCCGFTDDEVAEIADAVSRSTRIMSLDLRNSEITDAGATALAVAVTKNESLIELDLSDNKITDAGASCLAEAVAKSTSLTKLRLFLNRITDVGAEKLAAAITKNKSFRELYLGGNKITDTGGVALAKAVTESTSLTTLCVGFNNITRGGALVFLHAMVRARSCNYLWIYGPDFLLQTDRACCIRRAALATLALIGKPGDEHPKGTVSWLIYKDGDHAIWSRVFDFLV